MAQFNKDIAALDTQLGDAGLYKRDPARAQKLSIERGILTKLLADSEEKWLKATETYEMAAAA